MKWIRVNRAFDYVAKNLLCLIVIPIMQSLFVSDPCSSAAVVKTRFRSTLNCAGRLNYQLDRTRLSHCYTTVASRLCRYGAQDLLNLTSKSDACEGIAEIPAVYW